MRAQVHGRQRDLPKAPRTHARASVLSPLLELLVPDNGSLSTKPWSL